MNINRLKLKNLSKRDKQALGLLAAVGGGILLLFGFILPLYDAGASLEDELGQQENRLERYVQMIQEEEIYHAQLAQLDRLLGEYRQKLLEAPNESVAISQLEQVVRSIAADYEIDVARTSPLPERKIGDYAQITLQLNLQSDMDQLTSFLHALSAHPKFLLVEDFFLNSFRSREGVRIQPRMNISGFIRLS